MTINVPVQCELISTSVAYRVAEYVATNIYLQNTEARIADSVYSVKSQKIAHSLWSENVEYSIGDFVAQGDKVFEKVEKTFTYFSWCTTAQLHDSGQKFAIWDGNISTAPVAVCSASVQSDVSIVEKTSPNPALYRLIDFTMTFAGGSPTTTEYKLYPDIKTTPPQAMCIYEGFLILVYYAYNATLTNTKIWREIIEPTIGKDYENNLLYLRPSIKQIPFDTKQYTSVVKTGGQSWEIKVNGKFNGIAIGKLRGHSVFARFREEDETYVGQSTIDITGQIDTNITEEAITQIIYAPAIVGKSGTIYLVISPKTDFTETEVGIIFPILSVEIESPTMLQFSHDAVSFDREKVSEISGYIEHIRGNRVIYHKGSFEINMSDYDKFVLLTKRLLQELVAIDGCDMVDNQAADGIGLFGSMKLIGRFASLSMASRIKNNDLDVKTIVNFEFKEIV